MTPEQVDEEIKKFDEEKSSVKGTIIPVMAFDKLDITVEDTVSFDDVIKPEFVKPIMHPVITEIKKKKKDNTQEMW